MCALVARNLYRALVSPLRCSAAVTLILICISAGSQAQDNAAVKSADVGAEKPVTSDVENPFSSTVAKPRWELGVGSIYLWGHDYPGSRNRSRRPLVVPYFIYRSPRLRVGGGGLKAMAIERPRLKLDLSIAGSLNAKSTDENARQNMPNIDYLFELGPGLAVQLIDRNTSLGGRVRSQFTSKLRAVFSSDFRSADARGFVAEFGFSVNVDDIAGTKIRLSSGFDSTFATEKLQDYFYQVDEQFVTDSRAQYDAKGGYLGSVIYAGMSFKPLPQVRLFAGVNVGFFNGASNQDSPLFEVTEQVNFALGGIWKIKTSKDTVDIIELGAEDS